MPAPALTYHGREQGEGSARPLLLDVRNLELHFRVQGGGVARAVDGLWLSLRGGECLGLVGESGCGKSVAALSLVRLVDSPDILHLGGQVLFEGRDLLSLARAELRRVRGGEIAFVFQEPATALNPLFSVGEQVAEVLRCHRGMGRGPAREEAARLLSEVGIPSPELRGSDLPHQLSGGMQQRVMIAMALASAPSLLVADEPTTALDVTVQAQILALLARLQQERGMAILLISHDLGVVAELAERVAVMYAGRVVEQAPTARIFASPQHPYTRGLMRSLPRLSGPRGRLEPIRGQVPDPAALPEGCRFRPRCLCADGRCFEEPLLEEQAPDHLVACHHPAGGGAG